MEPQITLAIQLRKHLAPQIDAIPLFERTSAGLSADNAQALARLAAFRIPSEAQGLKWDHIAWEAKRISVVDSSKTEHRAKRAVRVISMLPAIEVELLAWFAEAPDGE